MNKIGTKTDIEGGAQDAGRAQDPGWWAAPGDTPLREVWRASNWQATAGACVWIGVTNEND
jgi:hypothetical protein